MIEYVDSRKPIPEGVTLVPGLGRNLVLWFMQTIREFGGEYEPYRDLTPPKKHTSGRREINAELREIQIRRWEKKHEESGQG